MAIRVFFEPTSCHEFMQRSLARLLQATRVAPEEELFVLLWHLGSYSWTGSGEENADDVRKEWLRLARELGMASRARILVLMPEEPQDLSRDPHAKFVFPDLLLKSILRDLSSEGRAVPFVLCTTYEKLAGRLSKGPMSPFLPWQGTNLDDSMLIRFCHSMAALPRETKALCPGEEGRSVSAKAKWIRHDDLFRFFHNSTGFRAEELHGSGPSDSRGDQGLTSDERFWARKVSALEHILSRVFLSPGLPLNILVVENNFKDLQGWNDKSIERHKALWKSSDSSTESIASCFGYLTQQSRFYLVSKPKDFAKIRSATERGRIEAEIYKPNRNGKLEKDGQDKVPWEDIDLVLQDVMLDKSGNAPTGLHYMPYYLEACPQALVFVLTGMDVESLAMSGDINWKYVDAVISKRKLGTLWWNYHQAFCRVFGRMFWPDFLIAKERNDGNSVLGDRQCLRNLFGSLRRWQLEPAILGHGQGLPEMIDHAHRHITALWRLVDDFVGALLENTGANQGSLSVENRILLVLGVWLHDIGHRGNEFTDDPADVRNTHGGISEYLLLRNPDAYGLQWLANDHCDGSCKDLSEDRLPKDNPRLQHRNDQRSCWENGSESNLCAIRQVGILCRHHQSNAPLTTQSLTAMCKKGKFPTPYTRYKDDGNVHSSQDELEEWLNRTDPLSGWPGSNVRLLQDFVVNDKQAFMTLAGLLRMLDGLQVHRVRVGSAASIKSFDEFLRVRNDWCAKELERVDNLLKNMSPGSKEYQAEIGKRFALERYQRLLNVQYVHWWRQLAVHEVKVLWRWQESLPEDPDTASSNGVVEIQFELDDGGLKKLDEVKPDIEIVQSGMKIKKRFDLKSILEAKFSKLCDEPQSALDRKRFVERLKNEPLSENLKLWAAHVAEEMIWSEHNSQHGTISGKVDCPAYLNALPNGVGFRIIVTGSTAEPLEDNPLVLLKSYAVQTPNQSHAK